VLLFIFGIQLSPILSKAAHVSADLSAFLIGFAGNFHALPYHFQHLPLLRVRPLDFGFSHVEE
jgi:hypothetical protein